MSEADPQAEYAFPDLDDSLGEASRLAIEQRSDPRYVQFCDAKQIPLDPRSPKYWRNLSEFYYREQWDNELSPEQTLALLELATPDVIFCAQDLPRLEREHSPYLRYTQERVARYEQMIHRVADAYPDLSLSTLALQLREAFALTGITDPRTLARAGGFIAHKLLTVQAERGLAAVLDQDPRVQTEHGSIDDRVNGAGLIAHVNLGRPGTIEVAITAHYNTALLRRLQGLAAEPEALVEPVHIKGQFDGMVAANMYSMLRPDQDYAEHFDPIPREVDSREGAAQELIASIYASGLTYLAR